VTNRSRPIVIKAQRTLVVIGVLLLAWAGYVRIASAWHRQQARAALNAPRAGGTDIPLADTFDRSQFAGMIEIPRIGLSEAFAEGDDDGTLRTAIGHLPDTPLPWHVGNVAFAGHRDQHFRPLRNIRVGDEIRLATPRGAFSYTVTETFIVTPQDLWVLAPTNGRELTLITCYPFNFIGHAPKRFVVKAETATGTTATTGDRNALAIANFLQ
jgi:sortase A